MDTAWKSSVEFRRSQSITSSLASVNVHIHHCPDKHLHLKQSLAEAFSFLNVKYFALVCKIFACVTGSVAECVRVYLHVTRELSAS